MKKRWLFVISICFLALVSADYFLLEKNVALSADSCGISCTEDGEVEYCSKECGGAYMCSNGECAGYVSSTYQNPIINKIFGRKVVRLGPPEAIPSYQIDDCSVWAEDVQWAIRQYEECEQRYEDRCRVLPNSRVCQNLHALCADAYRRAEQYQCVAYLCYLDQGPPADSDIISIVEDCKKRGYL